MRFQISIDASKEEKKIAEKSIFKLVLHFECAILKEPDVNLNGQPSRDVKKEEKAQTTGTSVFGTGGKVYSCNKQENAISGAIFLEARNTVCAYSTTRGGLDDGGQERQKVK